MWRRVVFPSKEGVCGVFEGRGPADIETGVNTTTVEVTEGSAMLKKLVNVSYIGLNFSTIRRAS